MLKISWGIVLTTLIFGAFSGTVLAQSEVKSPTPLSGTKIKLKNTMNFKDCLEYKLGLCVRVCPSFFGAYPVIGIKPKYQEPTALIETSCLKGETELGKAGGVNIIGGMLTGSSLKNPKEQKCADGIKSPGSQITRNFDEAHVYGFSGLTRYFTSASVLDATLSLSCGEKGVAGSLSDYTNKAREIMKSGGAPSARLDLNEDVTNQLASLMQAETRVTGAPEDGVLTAQLRGQSNDANGENDTPEPVSTFGTSVLGEVPETILVNGKMRATGRFLNTGPSQIAAETIEREFEAKLNLVNFYAEEAERLVGEARNVTQAADLCNLNRILKSGAVKLEENEADVKRHGLEVYNNGTYLARDFPQEYDDKAASCPLTNAGYVLVPALNTNKGSTRRPLNCEMVCDGERPTSGKNGNSGGPSGKGSQCNLEPKLGFAGSCDAPLSQIQVERKYPACNGRVPQFRTRTDREGNVTQTLTGYTYDARLDHRKQLNDARTQTFLRAVKASQNAVERAQSQLERRLDSLNLSCSVSQSQQMTPVARINVPEYSLSAQARLIYDRKRVAQAVNTDADNLGRINQAFGDATTGYDNIIGTITDGVGEVLAPIDNAVGTANDVVNSVTSGITDGVNAFGERINQAFGEFQLGSAELDGLTEKLDTVGALARPGGVRQAGNNMVGQALPFGLYPAFISELTNWSEPPKFDLVGQIKQQIGSTVQASLGGFECLGPAHAADYGIVGGESLKAVNKIVDCVGTWGRGLPATGWSFNKARPVGAALIFYRGHKDAVKFGAIQKNTKGTQQFNMDYPFVKGSGKHKGSGCYNVGTGKPFYTESGNLFELPKPSSFAGAGKGTLDVQDGKHVFTTWKKTSCCIWWCNGKKNIERFY